MELLIVGLIIGVILGFYICFKSRLRTIGSLKIAKDEDNVPYLFLQISNDELSEIYKRAYVTFKVDIKNINAQ